MTGNPTDSEHEAGPNWCMQHLLYSCVMDIFEVCFGDIIVSFSSLSYLETLKFGLESDTCPLSS